MQRRASWLQSLCMDRKQVGIPFVVFCRPDAVGSAAVAANRAALLKYHTQLLVTHQA
jgi:hypothetical protein